MTTIEQIRRPTVTDEMIRAAALSVVQEYLPDVDLDASVDAICRQYRRHMDGYELALELIKWEMWEVTRDEMEALDAIESRVSDAFKKAEKEWFAAFPVEPPFPVGARITRGVIASIYEYAPAYYCVKENGCTQEGRHLLIKFEDARATKEVA